MRYYIIYVLHYSNRKSNRRKTSVRANNPDEALTLVSDKLNYQVKDLERIYFFYCGTTPITWI